MTTQSYYQANLIIHLYFIIRGYDCVVKWNRSIKNFRALKTCGCKFRAVSRGSETHTKKKLPRWQLPSNPSPTGTQVTQMPYRQHKLGFEGNVEVIKNV